MATVEENLKVRCMLEPVIYRTSLKSYSLYKKIAIVIDSGTDSIPD